MWSEQNLHSETAARQCQHGYAWSSLMF